MILSVIIGLIAVPITTASSTMYLLSLIDRTGRQVMPIITVIILVGLVLAGGIILCTPQISASGLLCDTAARHGVNLAGDCR